MNREETLQLLMVTQAAYPNFKPQDKAVTLNIWHMMLEDCPYEVAMAGLQVFIKTDESGFAPSIGQLIGCIKKIQRTQNGEELTEMEAWVLVSQAIKNSGYYATEEFEKLPPLVQKAVGSPAQLREWALSPSDQVHSVGQSNFMRTYRTVLKRENESAVVNSALQGITAKTVKALEVAI